MLFSDFNKATVGEGIPFLLRQAPTSICIRYLFSGSRNRKKRYTFLWQRISQGKEVRQRQYSKTFRKSFSCRIYFMFDVRFLISCNN